MNTHRYLDVWEPSPVLRSVRHQVNNLLAPVTVAAEILEDGSDVGAMLQRSTDRIRRVTARLALLVRPGVPVLEMLDAAELFTVDVEVAGELTGLFVRADAERLRTRLAGELLANGATVRCSLDSIHVGSVDVAALCVRSELTGSDLSDNELIHLPVPLTMRSGGLGLAIASLETHLHGGRVRLSGEPGVIEFLLPLTPVS